MVISRTQDTVRSRLRDSERLATGSLRVQPLVVAHRRQTVDLANHGLATVGYRPIHTSLEEPEHASALGRGRTSRGWRWFVARSNDDVFRQEYAAQFPLYTTRGVDQHPPVTEVHRRDGHVSGDDCQGTVVGDTSIEVRFRAQPRRSGQTEVAFVQDLHLKIERLIGINARVNEQISGMFDTPRQFLK